MISKKKKNLLITLLAVLLVAAIVSAVVSKKQFRESKTTDLQTAYTLSESGQRDKAIELLKDRYDADKSDKQVAKQLATYYFQNKQYEEFAKIVEKADLNDTQVLTMRAFVSRGKGEVDNTINFYREAIKTSPRSGSAYANLINYYQVLGQNDKALEVAKEGINYLPQSGTLNLLASTISLQLGDKAAAKEYAQKVLEVDSENARAKEIISDLT